MIRTEFKDLVVKPVVNLSVLHPRLSNNILVFIGLLLRPELLCYLRPSVGRQYRYIDMGNDVAIAMQKVQGMLIGLFVLSPQLPVFRAGQTDDDVRYEIDSETPQLVGRTVEHLLVVRFIDSPEDLVVIGLNAKLDKLDPRFFKPLVIELQELGRRCLYDESLEFRVLFFELLVNLREVFVIGSLPEGLVVQVDKPVIETLEIFDLLVDLLLALLDDLFRNRTKRTMMQTPLGALEPRDGLRAFVMAPINPWLIFYAGLLGGFLDAVDHGNIINSCKVARIHIAADIDLPIIALCNFLDLRFVRIHSAEKYSVVFSGVQLIYCTFRVSDHQGVYIRERIRNTALPLWQFPKISRTFISLSFFVQFFVVFLTALGSLLLVEIRRNLDHRKVAIPISYKNVFFRTGLLLAGSVCLIVCEIKA